MEFADYPRPDANNGRGIHWLPTLSQSRQVIDRFLPELEALHVKWVAMRCGLDSSFPNDYLVESLLRRDIMPIMLLFRESIEPMGRRELSILEALVLHYRSLGVRYFQPYGQPNLRSSWRGGKLPREAVPRALDAWIPVADVIASGGGLPGLFPLAPGGDYVGGDMRFLDQAFREIEGRD